MTQYQPLFPSQPDSSVIIGAGACVADSVKIGPWTVIHDGVTLEEGVIIGERCTVHSGVVLGVNSRLESDVVLGKPPRPSDQLETIIGSGATIRRGSTIYSGNTIGEGLQTGDFARIRHGNQIGRNVSVGAGSEIAFETMIGDEVRMHSGVAVFEYTQIGNGVWLMPGVSIANDLFPRNTRFLNGERGREVFQPVVLEDGCVIGMRATLGPGVRVGQYALVGMGSVVTRNVAEFTLVYGNPAKEKGNVRELKYRDKDQELVYAHLEKLIEGSKS